MSVLKVQCGNGYACVRGDGAILPMSKTQTKEPMSCASRLRFIKTRQRKKITTRVSDAVLEYKTRHLSRVLYLL